MKKVRTNRMLTTLITLLLLLSMIPLITNTVSAASASWGSYDDYGICGEKVNVKENDSSIFNAGERVYMFFSNNAVPDQNWSNATFTSNTSYLKTWVTDSNNNFSIDYNVPYRNSTGWYGVIIVNNTNFTHAGTYPGDHIDFWFNITDVYKVEVDPEVIFWDDTERQDFIISIYNWTGTSYSLLTQPVRYIFWEPDELMDVCNGTTNEGTVDTDALFNWTALYGNAEANYTLQITKYTDESVIYAEIYVPVRYHLTELSHSAVSYGSKVTLKGRLIDGGDDVVVGKEILVVSPTNQSEGTTKVITSDSGRFTYYVDFDEAGTWYIGTLDETSGEYRPEDSETTRDTLGFIWYETIECSPQTGTIEVDPDETVKGFNASFDITCYDANDDELEGAYVYVTGIELWYNNNLEDKDNITEIDISDADGMVYIYESHGLIFDDTGYATFLFTHNNTFDHYDSDDDGELDDEDIQPNIYAETKVEIKTPAHLNVFVNYTGKDRVLLGDITMIADPDGYADPPVNPYEWGNWSSYIDIKVYGKSNTLPKNATVTITGCGIDKTYDEEDELYEAPDGYGHYKFLISPRKGGILTVTVTNGSLSATEEIEIKGLDADATTSVGDDKTITVDKNETVYFTTDTYYAEVHALLYNEEWEYQYTLNETIGDKTEGNGLDGTYAFMPDVSILGYIVISAREGYGPTDDETNFYGFDIIEIVPEYDLVVTVIEPDQANDTLTAGLEYDIVVEITNLTGYELDYADIDYVRIELLDDEEEVIPDMFGSSLTEDWDTLSHDDDNIWRYDDWTPHSNGTVRIWVRAWMGKHQGNNTDVTVDWATFEYNPIKLTAGIDLEDIGVEVIAYDALGNIIPEESFEMFNESNDPVSSVVEDHWAGNSTGSIDLDENGMATLWFDYIGNCTGYYYAKLNNVNTSGKLYVDYPIFEVDPTVIYVGIVNEVEIIVKDWAGNLLEDIYITFWPSYAGMAAGVVPDPVATDENGYLIMSLEPEATGKMNLSLVRDRHYEGGQLNWTNLLTDTTLLVTTKEPMEVTVSQSPIYQGDTLTVTVMSEGEEIEDVNIKFGSLTGMTDSNGEVDFTVPDPGVDSALYYIKAEKTGYITETIGLTVIKKYAITIVTPDEAYAGESFSVTITAKGQPLSGATVTLDGTTTKTSDGEGKVSFTAGAKDATHTITATYEPYTAAQASVGPVKEKGTPGFELLTLIIAIGVAFILLRRRKQN